MADFGIMFGFEDGTSAKLRDRTLTGFPAMGCAVAGLPRKWTDAGLSGDRLGPATRRRGKPGRAGWRAGDNWGGGRRAEILRADCTTVACCGTGMRSRRTGAGRN